MRTRRSPRNQEILWRALGGPRVAEPQKPKPRLCLYCVNFPGLGFAQGECTLLGEIKRAMATCPAFEARP